MPDRAAGTPPLRELANLQETVSLRAMIGPWRRVSGPRPHRLLEAPISAAPELEPRSPRRRVRAEHWSRRVRRPAALTFTGLWSSRTGFAAPGCWSHHHSRSAPVRSRAPRRNPGPARAASTRRELFQSSLVRASNISATSRLGLRAGRFELLLDQVLAARPHRHHACQNFGSSAPSVTQPSLPRRAGSRRAAGQPAPALAAPRPRQ